MVVMMMMRSRVTFSNKLWSWITATMMNDDKSSLITLHGKKKKKWGFDKDNYLFISLTSISLLSTNDAVVWHAVHVQVSIICQEIDSLMASDDGGRARRVTIQSHIDVSRVTQLYTNTNTHIYKYTNTQIPNSITHRCVSCQTVIHKHRHSNTNTQVVWQFNHTGSLSHMSHPACLSHREHVTQWWWWRWYSWQSLLSIWW